MRSKNKTRIRIKAYSVVQTALESGLQFALNRLQDAAGDRDLNLDDELRARALDPMMNEIMIALEDVVDWERSG